MRGMTHRPTAPQSSVVHRLIRGLAAEFSTGLSLGLPVSCAGCGRWETALCPRCHELLEGEPFNVEHADAAGDLDILALTTYTGPVRTMVLGWKNGSREDLDEVMAHAGRRLGHQWAQGRPAKAIWTASLPHTPALLVVPAPSGIARRLRGRLVAARLADAVASGIAEQWAQREQATLWDEPPAGDAPASMPSREALPTPLVLSADLLRRRGGGAHQAGRSSRQRRGNRAAAPRLLAPVSGLPVLLVDDVVTTGATLGACARAMQEAGGRVQGALALSAAPPPAHARVMVPVRTVTATPTMRSTGAPVAAIDPAPSDLSACGDQGAHSGRGTREREA